MMWAVSSGVTAGNWLTNVVERLIDYSGGKSPETVMNEAVDGNRGSASASTNTHEG